MLINNYESLYKSMNVSLYSLSDNSKLLDFVGVGSPTLSSEWSVNSHPRYKFCSSFDSISVSSTIQNMPYSGFMDNPLAGHCNLEADKECYHSINNGWYIVFDKCFHRLTAHISTETLVTVTDTYGGKTRFGYNAYRNKPQNEK